MSNLGGTNERDTRDAEQEPRGGGPRGNRDLPQATASARSDAARWREWMQIAFPAAVFDGRESGSPLDLNAINAVADELAHSVAAVAHLAEENWDFTLDLGHLGQIDGQASIDAGEIRITLYPRGRQLARLLRSHRESIEQMAGADTRNGIVLAIG